MVGGACLAGVIDALCRQSLMTVGGSKAAMSAIEWFAIDMRQGMRAGGFATKVEMENAIADYGVATIE